MKGIRTNPRRLKSVRSRCQKLREEGLSFPEIGKKLKLHHSTVMYHLGLLPDKHKKHEPVPNMQQGVEQVS